MISVGECSDNSSQNFTSCCRLCLSENVASLKPIFDNNSKGRQTARDIKNFLGVEISQSDGLTTMLCDSCIERVQSWSSFKKECGNNQKKLLDWMVAANPAADISVHIKDEVMDVSQDAILIDDDSGDDLVAGVRIKQEAAEYRQNRVEPDTYDDQPPPLTPHMPEDENEEPRSPCSTNGDFLIAPDVISIPDDDEEDFEMTSLVRQPLRSKDTDENDDDDIDDEDIGNEDDDDELDEDKMRLLVPRIEFTEGDPLPDGTNEESIDSYGDMNERSSENDKMRFCAGLRLQHSSASSNCMSLLDEMNLSKVEEAYIVKYKEIVQMFDNFVCTCHGESFEEERDLFLHLQDQRSWFAANTCYNCLMTFGDRKGYMKHFCDCPKSNLENLKKLIEKPMNLEVKLRLYHSYKCIKCKCIFGFHEDFGNHLDIKHMDLGDNTLPYECFCNVVFYEEKDFREHLSISCFLRHFCDICFDEFSNQEDFKKHCELLHDDAEADTIECYDAYRKCKLLNQPGENPSIKQGKRSIPNDPSNELDPELKRQRIDDFLLPPDIEIKQETILDQEYCDNLRTSRPCDCPVCGKPYSSYHNMLRHYKISHNSTGLALSCRFCPMRFRLTSELKEHSMAHHPEETGKRLSSNALIPQSSKRSLNGYACPDCGDTFKTLNDWTVHMETHPKKVCEDCGAEYYVQSELEHHQRTHVKVYRDSRSESCKAVVSPASLKCNICKKNFNSRPELRQHKLLHERMPVLPKHDEEDQDEKNEKKPSSTRTYFCVTCNKDFENYSLIWEHNKKHHDGRSVDNEKFPRTCEICEKVVTSRGAWSNHQKMHDREIAGPHAVFRSPSPPVFTNPRRISHPQGNDDGESYYTCKRCFKVFANKQGLKSHMRCHGIYPKDSTVANRTTTKTSGKVNKTFWCDICHQACIGFAELQEHKKEHSAKKPNRMINPNNPEERKLSLSFDNSHSAALRREHKSLPFYCQSCNIPFKTIGDFEEHNASEHGTTSSMNKPSSSSLTKPRGSSEIFERNQNGDYFPCQMCSKVFDNAGSLATHQGWHKRGSFGKKVLNPNRPRRLAQSEILPSTTTDRFMGRLSEAATSYTCNQCPKRFASEMALHLHTLETHRNVNATVVSLSCKSCRVNFSNKDAYDDHMKAHYMANGRANDKSPKAYQCKYCVAGFSRSDTLNLHVRTSHREHYNDKYKCNVCDRTFDKQNALTIHLKTHERQRLSNEVTLVPHPSQGRTGLTCSICNQTFSKRSDLCVHTFEAHPF